MSNQLTCIHTKHTAVTQLMGHSRSMAVGRVSVGMGCFRPGNGLVVISAPRVSGREKRIDEHGVVRFGERLETVAQEGTAHA